MYCFILIMAKKQPSVSLTLGAEVLEEGGGGGGGTSAEGPPDTRPGPPGQGLFGCVGITGLSRFNDLGHSCATAINPLDTL